MADSNKDSYTRIPSWQQIMPVFSIILFLVCSWALYRTFWYLPSWLEYLSIWNILVILAYVFAHSLIESLVVVLFVLGISLVLPANLIREDFVVQGSLLALTVGAGALLIQRRINIIYDFQNWQIISYSILALFVLFLLVILFHLLTRRFPTVSRLIQAFAEKMTIFSWVYIPLGILGLIIVILRNLF